MKIFTTINPNGDYNTQLNAIESWSKYEVYSVNTKDEIDKINGLYPNVKFIETTDVFDYNGRKLIKLNSILSAIESICYNCNVGIVNSDIILNSKIKGSIFNDKFRDSLVIATRYELDNGEIYPFNDGYDLFIFNSKYINLFKNKNYVIGMPWWDFWIPTIALKSGMKIYHVKNQIIYHKTHETNYDKDIWIRFGEYLYNDIMINLMKNPASLTVNDFARTVKLFIEKKQINIKI